MDAADSAGSARDDARRAAATWRRLMLPKDLHMSVPASTHLLLSFLPSPSEFAVITSSRVLSSAMNL